jgi:endonuclease/exonuclease/phosphatase (EEP) superfamily protein YafD
MMESSQLKKPASASPTGRWRRVCPVVALCICVLGLLVHYVLRDRFDGIAVVYYALGRPILGVVAGVGFVAALCCFRRYRILVPLAILCLWGFTPLLGNQTVDPLRNVDGTVYRILLWNVSHGEEHWAEIIDTIQTEEPDAIALTEVSKWRDHQTGIGYWAREFPRLSASSVDHSMVFLTRGDIQEGPHVDWDHGQAKSRYRVFQATVEENPVTIVLVDFISTPTMSRQRAFEALTTMLHSIPGPVILLGDFNTPSGSVFFEGMPQGYSNAAGDSILGNAPTWPFPFPFLDIDQIWTRGLTVHHVHALWSKHSDHRPLLMHFSFPNEKGSTP